MVRWFTFDFEGEKGATVFHRPAVKQMGSVL